MTSAGIAVGSIFSNKSLSNFPLNINKEEAGVSIMENLNDASECKDGKNDGKIGFIETAKALKNGAKEELKRQSIGKVKEAVKNPLKTALAATAIVAGVAAATTIIGTPAVMACLGVIGTITGVKNIIKDVSNLTSTIDKAKNAKTDAEKTMLMEQLGKNGINIIEDTSLAAVSSLQVIRAGAKIAGCSEMVENTIQKVSNSTVSSIETTSENITNTLEKIDNIYDGKYEIVLANTATEIDNTVGLVNQGIDFSLKASNTMKDDVMGLIYITTRADKSR